MLMGNIIFTDVGLLSKNHEKRTHEDQINFAMKASQKQAVVEVTGHSIFILLIWFALLQLIGCTVYVWGLLNTS